MSERHLLTKEGNMAEDYAWEHAKIVADRCAKRFGSRTEIERYLAAIGWEWSMIERMMRYLERKKQND